MQFLSITCDTLKPTVMILILTNYCDVLLRVTVAEDYDPKIMMVVIKDDRKIWRMTMWCDMS